jgi:hypothetical protein
MKKQTAVEWLVEELKIEKGIDFISTSLFQKAIIMEKQLHEQTATHFFPTSLKKEDFEQYYNNVYEK